MTQLIDKRDLEYDRLARVPGAEAFLAEYDRMAAAGLTLETPLTEGESGTYRSTLTPSPGDGPRHSA